MTVEVLTQSALFFMLGVICLTKQLCLVYLYRIQPLDVGEANKNSQSRRHRLKCKQRRAPCAYAKHTFLDPTSRHHKGENGLTPTHACLCAACGAKSDEAEL